MVFNGIQVNIAFFLYKLMKQIIVNAYIVSYVLL
jgi:hypothetical protein